MVVMYDPILGQRVMWHKDKAFDATAFWWGKAVPIGGGGAHGGKEEESKEKADGDDNAATLPIHSAT